MMRAGFPWLDAPRNRTASVATGAEEYVSYLHRTLQDENGQAAQRILPSNYAGSNFAVTSESILRRVD